MKDDRMLINISLVCSSILFVSGLWAIDIGSSAMILNTAGYMTNTIGLSGEREGVAQYHLGMIMCLIGFISAILTLSWRNKK